MALSCRVTKGISRELIVQAALEVLDENGIDGLTARALGERLGVRAPALYWHISGMPEILDEMGTEIRRRVAAELAAEPDVDRWREGLAAYGRILRRQYLAHRDGARTFSAATLTDPAVLAEQQRWLTRWTATGLSDSDLITAAKIVSAFVTGFVIEEQDHALPNRYLLAQHPAHGGGTPRLAAAVRELPTPDQRFELNLDIVLTGVETRLGGARPRPAPLDPPA